MGKQRKWFSRLSTDEISPTKLSNDDQLLKTSDLFKKECVVYVKNACKYYFSKKHKNHVLANLNMHVKKGTIYGLLGASGCGKTTLLSCIIGLKHLDKGKIYVMGKRPSDPESGIPGKRIGYMPQEIALYEEFTIKETMMYYGWIFGMKTEDIEGRCEFLVKLLDLPTQKRTIKKMSGGQQRRVSFAIALLHDPELLILDEPTVGVDPVLRQNIWKYLVEITKLDNKTVIITTHYIEEAMLAHTIGLMRSGRLLAEESPQRLIEMYDCSTLEGVFLKLSKKQGPLFGSIEILRGSPVNESQTPSGQATTSEEESGSIVSAKGKTSDAAQIQPKDMEGNVLSEVEQILESIVSDSLSLKKKRERRKCQIDNLTWGRLRALLTKDFVHTCRNYAVMLFIFFMPVLQVVLFCVSIGRDPHDLNLGIVNQEVTYVGKTVMPCKFSATGCVPMNLSCRYVDNLKSEKINLIYFNSVEEATQATINGETWGYIHFKSHYTSAALKRFAMRSKVDEDTLRDSEISVRLDMSNHQVSLVLIRDINSAYLNYTKGILKDCGKNPNLANLPVHLETPIYGTSKPSFLNFVAPGTIITIIFFLAVALTSDTLIVERLSGLYDRSWVAGVTDSEILFSHVVIQFCVMCGQTALVLIFMLLVFKVVYLGNIGLIIFICISQGLCGMSFGFLISATCKTESEGIQVALGSFYPLLFLSGSIWPVQGMPIWLRYPAQMLPITMATQCLRSILTRGWSIEKFDVYMGIIATILWIVVFLLISLLIMKLMRK